MTKRYIVVQTGRDALFGVFTTPDEANAQTVSEAACESCAPWCNVEERPNTLDTSKYLSQIDNELCVFKVPDDFPAYDENSIDATSVDDGKIFENYRDFAFIGTLVQRVTLTAEYEGETYVGISDCDDHDLRFQLATEDLISEMPSGKNGETVDVKDEDDDVVGNLTWDRDYDYNCWIYQRSFRKAA